MIDPDALRQQILDDTLTWEKAEPHGAVEHEAAERISSAFAALDHHLRHGGTLPRAWAGARRLSGGGSGALGGPPAAGNIGGAGGGGGRAWDYDQDGEPQGPAGSTNLMGDQGRRTYDVVMTDVEGPPVTIDATDPARHGGYAGGGQPPDVQALADPLVRGMQTADPEPLPARRRRLLGRW